MVKSRKTTNTNAAPRDMHQEITNRIINLLENDNLDFESPFVSSYGAAKNYKTGEQYNGINFLMLNFCADRSKIPYYLTFNQIVEMGGKLKKGSKSEQVIFFNKQAKDEQGRSLDIATAQKMKNEGAEVSIYGYLKYYNVFSVSDVEEIEIDTPLLDNKNELIETAEQTVKNIKDLPPIVSTVQTRAFYNPADDFINMSEIRHFTSSMSFYSTLFHEIAHATGHPKRLNRQQDKKNDRLKEYAFEELIAELAAVFVCTELKITSDKEFINTTSYLKSWLQALKNDKTFIFKAAAEAQKAANYILNKPNK